MKKKLYFVLKSYDKYQNIGKKEIFQYEKLPLWHEKLEILFEPSYIDIINIDIVDKCECITYTRVCVRDVLYQVLKSFVQIK